MNTMEKNLNYWNKKLGIDKKYFKAGREEERLEVAKKLKELGVDSKTIIRATKVKGRELSK